MKPNRNEDLDNQLAEKEQIKVLLQKMKTEAQGLRDVMWSREEMIGNKDFVNTKNLKINNMLNQIINNLYWYEKVGWKKFVPNKEAIEEKERQEQIKNEKERIVKWAVEHEKINETYFSFHRLMTDSDLLKILSANGYENFEDYSVLEVGCRDGSWLSKFLDWGALPNKLEGIDVFLQGFNSVGDLEKLGVHFIEAFPDKLPFTDKKFKIILMFGFLMHVLDESLRKNIGQELLRVLSDDGIIITVNLSQEEVMKVDPYLMYTSKGLDFEEMTAIFPDQWIDFKKQPSFNLAVIRKIGRKKEDSDRNGK